MHDDTPATNGRVETVIVDDMCACAILPPDLNTEGVRRAIASPKHEFVGIAIGIKRAIDCAAALELGVVATLVDHQPIICIRMEVEPTSLEPELGIAGRDGGPFLVFGNKPEGRLAG